MAAPDPRFVVQHEADADELITGEAVGLDLRPTSFVLRAAGAIIDFVTYAAGLLVFMLLLFQAVAWLGVDQAMTTALALAGVVLCTVVVPLVVELATRGRSLGKLAVGARIVRDDGGAIGFRHAFIRALVGLFEIFLTLGGGAAVIGLLSPRAKRLGDLLAGTYSQHERLPKTDPPVYGVPVELQTWAVTADVARLPDPLARRIAAFLAQAPRFTETTRQRLSAELAHEASVFVSPLPHVPAALFLAGVAALRREREAEALRLQTRQLEQLAPTLEALPHRFPERG
ncbi:RDD family protein [Ruicaihuangia caeni]|uniref:RDD family protein n=1 Tax=Ruicaihuangia caeni TaxID=3042517 RepID=A0AAW6T6N1_9MICO|nr:RDD family protein [Klugiella sp. YN-L-19]MDI2099442.1 RDD family protein [Klugiella sp. YN-L-19]